MKSFRGIERPEASGEPLYIMTPKTKTLYCYSVSRGIERIRTAVQAFAELCLATRPRCHFVQAKVLCFLTIEKLKPSFFLSRQRLLFSHHHL